MEFEEELQLLFSLHANFNCQDYCIHGHSNATGVRRIHPCKWIRLSFDAKVNRWVCTHACWLDFPKAEVFYSYWPLLQGGILAAPGALKIPLLSFELHNNDDSVSEIESWWPTLVKIITTEVSKIETPGSMFAASHGSGKEGKNLREEKREVEETMSSRQPH